MILVIDNYDSFVHNLARYFRQLGCETDVVRNDQISLQQIKSLAPEAIVVSPGPCTPSEAGISLAAIETFHKNIPILGICLGHQAIIQALGGQIVRASEPMHGRTSLVVHRGTPMFQQIASPFSAGRYHSLVGAIESLPESLAVTASTEEGTIMAIEHHSLPVVGLQFHPESILTSCGYRLLNNFLQLADLANASPQLIQQLEQTRYAATLAQSQLESDRPYRMSPRLVESSEP